MDDDDDNVFATSVIDRYAARPPILGNICLAKFAVNYNVTQAHHEFIDMQKTDAHEQSDTEEYDSCTKIRLKDGLGYTGGSHLSRTVVKPDSHLAQIFCHNCFFPCIN